MVLTETRSQWDLEERRQSSSLLEPEENLAPVALTGGLIGSVVDRFGLPAQARVVVRDATDTMVSECYTAGPRAGSAGGRFEVRGLSTGTYVVEIAAPGFAPQARRGVRIEAPCVTDLGAVRLLRAESPSIAAIPRGSIDRPVYPVLGFMLDRFR